ncbi:MAG: twin-arginine translocation pathway signal protein [Rhodospirillaceae bacterium]|nr:twin-arginine translocation pathway signal protein [Rhodospirillaceae bacterium]MBT5245223.1 twin-arginine translocation pathway signal protein [Rhodospirillaceae bacterium]MBT5561949.1 twin-arginine translocation pathway signal protein [Rhodospirillaceae bacterium]MBT6241933.1 twin-arginine translocation pathway signal protein [Rhodospirillaceae bacterium]MBT7137840.1 twin-arginine translocation pathway signal protein [Rhodospirillaceae bacterium]
MHRRDFIKVMAAGSGVVLLPSVLSGCGETAETGLEGWNGPMPGETDIRRIVLSYAILAPNPHNKQPWIVDLTGPDSFDLYVDQSRLLPETDPPFRQVHIGQGTFLENAALAAGSLGYAVDVVYFPAGQYGNTKVADKPVASVTLTKDGSARVDPLFAQITKRQSNKRVYDDTPVSAAQLAELAGSINHPGLGLTNEAGKRGKLADIARLAMEIETADKARDAETIAMFRFNDEERARFRDGFGVAQSGMSGLMKMVAETFFLDRRETEADSTDFGAQAVKITTDQANSAAAFGWITTPTNNRLDQLLTGRAYERLNLKATELGLAMHPMSQVLQEYTDMTTLQGQFLGLLDVAEGHTVQMLFRLGIAEPVSHSARRRLTDIMRG